MQAVMRAVIHAVTYCHVHNVREDVVLDVLMPAEIVTVVEIVTLETAETVGTAAAAIATVTWAI